MKPSTDRDAMRTAFFGAWLALAAKEECVRADDGAIFGVLNVAVDDLMRVVQGSRFDEQPREGGKGEGR